MMNLLFKGVCLEDATPAKLLEPADKPDRSDSVLAPVKPLGEVGGGGGGGGGGSSGSSIGGGGRADDEEGGPAKARRMSAQGVITQVIEPIMNPMRSQLPSFDPDEVKMLQELLADDGVIFGRESPPVNLMGGRSASSTTILSGASSFSDGDNADLTDSASYT